MSQQKIKILPDNIANKIAAGEVVQRPESVLKELLENSLDAETKNIEVFIKGSGKSLVQVVDDGSGMSEKDAIASLQRHATSKIESIDDLDKIITYGFRGEALSSIASVSQLEMKTEMRDEELGTLIRFEDGVGLKTEKGNFPKGTSVAVKNLFYNTPARRKFLKSNTTELKHLIETFKRTALSHPEIAFKFWNGDDLIFNFNSGDFENRLEEVIADNIFEAVIKVEEETEYLNIKGYVAKPTFLKKSKGEQYLFINRRYVVSKSLNHAVFSAYEKLLERGEYPLFVLFIEVDPSKVDVNVHPSKLEVKFDDEKNIYSFVHAVVKSSIGQYDLIPNVSINGNVDTDSKLVYGEHKSTAHQDFSDRPSFQKKEKQIFPEKEIDLLFSTINPEVKKNSPNGSVPHPFESGDDRKEVIHEREFKGNASDSIDSSSTTFIVPLHNKYILSQIKSGLMIIDQHVAHERILYEKALNSFEADIPFSQQLLFSQTVQVDPADYNLLKEIEPYLNKLGFEIKFFSKRTVVIDGVPGDIKIGSEIETLLNILKEYRLNEKEKKLDVKDNIAKSFSCNAAIKAGDKLSEQEMRVLVDQLFATSMPYVCPHGRPIIIKIPLDEFDKRFGRT